MAELILIIGLAVFYATNMGISGFSVAFMPSFGSRLLSHKTAVALYTVSVLAGASVLGPRVVETLTKKLSATPLTLESGLIILVACSVTMFIANAVKIPQSTSFVTVASFTGAAMYRGNVNWQTVARVFWVAVFFSALSFIITILIQRWAYPPRKGNLKLYEAVSANRAKLQKFIIGHDIYAGFSIGTNNVANVVAALAGLGIGSDLLAFFVFSLLFGAGALIAGERVIKVVAREIIPVGEFSASVVSILTATFVLIASYLGLPAPYVQFTTFSVLGISCIKDGFRATFAKAVVQKILWVWVAVPVFAFLSSYALHLLLLRGSPP